MAVVAENRPQLDPDTRRLLVQLRERIRRYIWVEGAALTVAILCAAFWLALAVDWLFEPAAGVRRCLLGVGLIAGVTTFYQFVIRRLAVPLPDSRLALLLERRFRYFDDSLLTSVDLTESDHELGDEAAEMLAHTCHEADHRAQGVQLTDLFNRTPLVRAAGAALLLVTSLAVCALAAPGAFRFGVDRLTGLTDELWPRTTRLFVRGFENGEKVAARGDDVDVLVQADMSMPQVPEVVQIRSRTEEGIRGRETMTRVGNASAADEFQDFHHKFPGVLSSMSFDVLGGDARIRDLRIRVVDSPTVRETVLSCEYPAYMNRSPRDVPVTGSMQIPLGTQVTVRAQANKDIAEVRMDYPLDDGASHSETIKLPGADGSLRHFQFTIPPLEADRTLVFTLLDTDGIRKPFSLPLFAEQDQPPQVAVQLSGIGTAITPEARLPIAGTIVDDYGVAEAAFQITIDEKETRQAPFATSPGGRSEVDVEEAFEVRDLELKPGQKLLFGAQASDAYHLAAGDRPHTVTGARFQLDVVTPETLRAMLESRELNLRQRFETIIAEVTETRDSLTEKPAEDASPEPSATEADKPAVDAPAAETAGATGPSEANLRVERARQNVEKNAQETLGVATAFDDIREELINNRVDTEELKIRLKDRIADPLRTVAEEMFPEWDRRLKLLQEKLPNPAAAASARRSALEQADAILVELVHVRAMMLELESFNEAIDMLRSIIGSEKALQERIRERQKRKVRDLLEDAK